MGFFCPWPIPFLDGVHECRVLQRSYLCSPIQQLIIRFVVKLASHPRTHEGSAK